MKSENIQKMVMAQLSPNLSYPNPQKTNKQAYCPFLFKGNREYPFNSKTKDNLNYPSPGSYEMKSSFTTQQNESLILLKKNGLYQRSTESNIFKSKIKRFEQKQKQGPAPNAYMNMSEFEKEQQITKKKKKMATMIKNMNKLLLNERKKETKPSIPSRREKNDSICLQSSRQKFTQNPMKNRLLQQSKIKTQINELKTYNFGSFNKNKQLDRLKQTTNMFILKTDNQEEREGTKSMQQQQRKNSLKIRKSKKVYYNKEKIEIIQKENKKHRQIGPGWYQSKSSFNKQKGKRNFQFFHSSTVRFYEENPSVDQRTLFYEDPYKKYKLITNKKPLRIGRKGKKIRQQKQDVFDMRFSIQSRKNKQKLLKFGGRQSTKGREEAGVKENREIKTSINKFSDYYKKKQESTKSNIRIRVNSNKKYHRIT